MKIQAVVTGDIIGFTKLAPAKRKKLIEDTSDLLKTWIKEKTNAEIFRGDSYQVLFEQAKESISRSVQLVCWFKKHSDESNDIHISTRISVGVGEVAYLGKNVLNSDGEAFHLSGRNFDTMKNEEFLSVHTGDSEKNEGIEIILNFVNKYLGNWTIAQAEVIFLLLEGKTQQEIAEQLNLTQPSVNSRLKSAGWKEFEPAITYMTKLVQRK
ncbi:MAG: sigma factor-like helix-turn-helix DNA-binding protein [Bacteroidota bacterium]